MGNVTALDSSIKAIDMPHKKANMNLEIQGRTPRTPRTPAPRTPAQRTPRTPRTPRVVGIPTSAAQTTGGNISLFQTPSSTVSYTSQPFGTSGTQVAEASKLGIFNRVG